MKFLSFFILRWFHTRISNGLLEGLSSLLQSAKARARRYRSTKNLTAMIYLKHGKLSLCSSHLKQRGANYPHTVVGILLQSR